MVAKESEMTLEPGDAAPDFELDGTDGRTYTLEDFDDAAALLVVFTCNHCPYAKAKFDLLNDVAADEDVAVVGINPNDAEQYPEDSLETMQAYVADGRVQYDAYLRDDSQTVAESYGAVCTPDPFLFRQDDDGTWRLAYHGRLDDALNPEDEPTRFHVREAIQSIRAGEPVEVDWEPSRGCSIKWRET